MARGRTRIVGTDRKALFRLLNRTFDNVTPKIVNHISKLPPARKNKGRIIYVDGTTKAHYKSDGVSWGAL